MKRRILTAVASLGLLKSLDYLFPLLIIPMALHALGVALYGVVSYYLSLSLFYLVIVDFGFNVYGVQKVAVTEEASKVKRFVVWSFAVRAMLFIFFVLPVHIFLSHIAPSIMNIDGYQHWLLLIAALNIFNLQWFFQVKEKFRLMISISFFIRLIALFWTYFGVREEADVNTYVNTLILMYGAPYLIHFIYFLITYSSVKIARVNSRYVIALIKMSSSVFGYRIANAAILPCFNYIFGFLMTSAEFGVMSLVQRIFGAVINFSSPILQALIPFFADLKRKDMAGFKVIYRKSFLYTLILSFFLSILSIFGTYLIVYTGVLGKEIALNDLFPHVLMMIAIIPHVINSLQSQVLVLQQYRYVVNHAVFSSLLLVGLLFIIGFFYNLSSIYYICFYLVTYYFMSAYLFWGWRRNQ